MAIVTYANAASILIAIGAIGYAVYTSSTFPPPKRHTEAPLQPKYYIPNQERDHLEHVEDAFRRAGYQLVTNENYSDDWYTMWTFHNPFWNREPSVDLPAMMKELKPHQKVNHLPGASHFTNKVDLAKRTQGFSFVPKSFLLPRQYAEWVEYHKQQDAPMTWLKKGGKHRGVRVVDPYDTSLAQETDKESIVQQLIKPYLIDNRLFDVGVYIAITSVNPLRMYYFDNVLVRACSEEYVEDLKKAPRDAYVVADAYMPPWGLPSFRPFYTWGMSTLNVLRAYFHTQGVEFENVFREMKADILELVGSYTEGMESISRKYPHGQSNFYSIYRVDFILDRNLKPWITEINQSPNLSSHYLEDLETMFQRIAYSLLSLVGLTPGGLHHPDSSERDLEILLHTNDIDIGYAICNQCIEDCSASEQCTLCRRCRTASQSNQLKELISEHRSRLGFIPLYPLRNSTREFFKHLIIPGEDNALLQSFVLAKCEQDYTWC